MIIRPATEADKPNIIALLKQSLGESTIPKSEALWSWKHEQNPFGASYVLVAEEDGMLVGLRAFMQWQWQWNNKTYHAIRAVDTATHPAYQGKGIFKKLTLQQAEACKQEGVHFVFNSPNEQSKPGYLKMGWVEQGKMPLKIKLLFPSAVASFINRNKERNLPAQIWNIPLVPDIDERITRQEALSTVLSKEYLAWRYAQNPLFTYQYFTDNKQFFIVTRIKPHTYVTELRIVDFVLLNDNGNSRQVAGAIKKQLFKFCREQNIGFITLSGQQYRFFKIYFNWMGILPVKAIGPIITLKNLNMDGRFDSLLNTENWCYSLGDMELF